MEYIIKRLRYKEMEFSKSDDLDKIIKSSETVVKNIMKCIEFHESSSTTIDHWTDVLIGKLGTPNELDYPYGLMFTRVMNNISSLPEDIKERLNDNLGHGEKFIRSMKIKLLADKKNGIEKYTRLVNSIDEFIYDDEYYIRILGILSLILDGNLGIDSFDPSEIWDYKYSNIITYEKNKKYHSIPKSKIRNIVDRYIKLLNYEN